MGVEEENLVLEKLVLERTAYRKSFTDVCGVRMMKKKKKKRLIVPRASKETFFFFLSFEMKTKKSLLLSALNEGDTQRGGGV